MHAVQVAHQRYKWVWCQANQAVVTRPRRRKHHCQYISANTPRQHEGQEEPHAQHRRYAAERHSGHHDPHQHEPEVIEDRNCVCYGSVSKNGLQDFVWMIAEMQPTIPLHECRVPGERIDDWN